MPIPGEKRYTVEEFYNLDIDTPCELIDGKIYDMFPSPSIRHQDISGELFYEIKSYIKRNGGKCRVFAALTDVKLSDDTVVVPDIFVACNPENFDEQKYNGAPDWVIEVASPSNSERDYSEKLHLYRDSGVKEYWVVDTHSEKVTVYIFGKPNVIEFYTFGDRITAGIFKDNSEPLTICLNEIL